MSTLGYGATNESLTTITVGGTVGNFYRIRAHLRAIVPLIQVVGGQWLGPHVVQGGLPLLDLTRERLGLSVPISPGVDVNYWLNATLDAATDYNVELDYYFDFVTAPGDIFFGLHNQEDSRQWVGDANNQLLTIDGVEYDGIIARVSIEATDFAVTTITKGGGIKDWIWSGFAEQVYAKGAEK